MKERVVNIPRRSTLRRCSKYKYRLHTPKGVLVYDFKRKITYEVTKENGKWKRVK